MAQRESSVLHRSWVYEAGGRVRGVKRENYGNEDPAKEVVQLKFSQRSNEEQMQKLFKLLKREPLVINHYLQSVPRPRKEAWQSGAVVVLPPSCGCLLCLLLGSFLQ